MRHPAIWVKLTNMLEESTADTCRNPAIVRWCDIPEDHIHFSISATRISYLIQSMSIVCFLKRDA